MLNITYAYPRRDGSVVLEDLEDPKNRILVVRGLDGEGHPVAKFFPQYLSGDWWFHHATPEEAPIHSNDLLTALELTRSQVFRQEASK